MKNVVATIFLFVSLAIVARAQTTQTRDAQELLAKWLREPLSVKYRVRFQMSGKIEPGDWDQRLVVQVQKDGKINYSQERTEIDDKHRLQLDSLHRGEELVRFQTDWENDSIRHKVSTFTSPNASPDIVPASKGSIFHLNRHCPPAGCVDGYFLEAYFPQSLTKVEKLSDSEVHLTSTTDFGKAEVWLDSTRSHMPTRLSIEKTADHLTNGNRKVGSVLYNKKDPKSRLEKIVFEVGSFDIRESEGFSYIAKCTLTGTKFSGRGEEEVETTTWEVESIRFEPGFQGGIYPDVEVSDGEVISAEGAPQLPYRWSKAERWVVPATSPMQGNTNTTVSRSLVVSVFVLVLILFSIFKLAKRPVS